MATESEVMVREGNLPPTAFQTERLWLHAARADHAPGLFADYTGDLEASRFLPRGPHQSQAQTLAVIDAWGADRWTSNDRFAWSIIDRESDRPICHGHGGAGAVCALPAASKPPPGPMMSAGRWTICRPAISCVDEWCFKAPLTALPVPQDARSGRHRRLWR